MKTYSPDDVARMFGVSPSAVYLWIYNGQLRAERVTETRGDVWRISESTLKTFKRPKQGRPKKGKK